MKVKKILLVSSLGLLLASCEKESVPAGLPFEKMYFDNYAFEVGAGDAEIVVNDISERGDQKWSVRSVVEVRGKDSTNMDITSFILNRSDTVTGDWYTIITNRWEYRQRSKAKVKLVPNESGEKRTLIVTLHGSMLVPTAFMVTQDSY